jgi:hypothetical protein
LTTTIDNWRKMSTLTKKKLVAIAEQYAYAALVAVATAYVAGYTSPSDLLKAALIAILGPLAIGANPKNSAYGVGSKK